MNFASMLFSLNIILYDSEYIVQKNVLLFHTEAYKESVVLMNYGFKWS
jgi:hypothetical protein